MRVPASTTRAFNRCAARLRISILFDKERVFTADSRLKASPDHSFMRPLTQNAQELMIIGRLRMRWMGVDGVFGGEQMSKWIYLGGRPGDREVCGTHSGGRTRSWCACPWPRFPSVATNDRENVWHGQWITSRHTLSSLVLLWLVSLFSALYCHKEERTAVVNWQTCFHEPCKCLTLACWFKVLKVMVHPKMKILSCITHPQVVQNLNLRKFG